MTHSTDDNGPLRALAIVLPALVDHPGNVAWQRGIELARALDAEVHVLHTLHGKAPEGSARERRLVAAERGLQQWVLGRCVGKPIAQRIMLHVVWQVDTLRALDTLVEGRGVDTVVIAPTDDRRDLVAEVIDRLPCSVHLAAERLRQPERDAEEVLRAEAEAEPVMRSTELAVPGPLPEPPVVADAVG